MKICFILNPKSGPKSTSEILEKSINSIKYKDHKLTLLQTKAQNDAKIFAEKAVKEKFDIVIAVGGDGTINEVINGLINSNLVLGIIPTGTANVFAKEIGIPTLRTLNNDSIISTINKLLENEIKQIDLGKVKFKNNETRYFLMWCGIGLDAMITSAKKSPKDIFLGRYLNYISWALSALKISLSFSPSDLEIKYENKLISENINQILISNGQLYANYFTISKTAKLDDGLLDILLFKGNVFQGFIKKGFKSLFKRKLYSDFEIIQTNKIIITSKIPLPVHVDAETIGTTPVEIELIPKALKVLMPKI